MPFNGLQTGSRKECQSRNGTTELPSSVPTSCARLMFFVLDSTTPHKSVKQLTSHLRNRCFSRPKHQSGANFVCPGGMKFKVTDVWRPWRVLHAKYHNMYLFLFCPEQLSQWSSTCCSPNPKFSKKWCSRLITIVEPLLTDWLSSIK